MNPFKVKWFNFADIHTPPEEEEKAEIVKATHTKERGLSVRPLPNNKAPPNRGAFLYAINSKALMCTNDQHKQNFSTTALNSSMRLILLGR